MVVNFIMYRDVEIPTPYPQSNCVGSEVSASMVFSVTPNPGKKV